MTFVNQLKRPFVVGVLRGRSADDGIANILNSECEGADAFDLHIHWLPAEQRDEKTLRRIFSSTKKPCLALFYREGTPFNTPAASEICAPTSTRLKMSRPSESTPNQCSIDGPSLRRS